MNSLTRRFVYIFFGILAVFLMQGSASAATTPTAAGGEDSLFATVHRLRGEVKAGTSGSAERSLQVGDRVFIGEKVTAAATSEAVLRTLDAGMVAVRPGAEFIVQGFTAKGDKSDNMALKLLTGSLRVITGWIGRSNPSAHRIITPSATIGIRGTDHEPFVLTSDIPTADAGNPYRAGTYDKVNRGGTTLTASGKGLDIDPGKVGFVRADAKAHRSRALMTLLLPVLLDKIPEFYVPGEFDAELDRFSAEADALAQKELEQKLQPKAEAVAPVAAAATAPAAVSAPAVIPVTAKCEPTAIAKAWLGALDDGIVRKDAASILGQFADDVDIVAIVRKKDGGIAEVTFTRDELVRSTVATVNQLEGYQHRRISIEAKKEGDSKARNCQRLLIKSVVIEQGRLSGKPYRFESVENFVLEPRDGKWLAVKAESAQR